MSVLAFHRGFSNRFVAACRNVVAPAVLPALVGIGLIPFVNGGSVWPWMPFTVDLDVYRYTGQVLLDGGDILTARAPDTELAFIYPAFAALLCVPLTLVPYTLLQVIWTGLNAFALSAVLHRLGLRGWMLALAATVCLVAVEPVRSTFGFGQINLFLLAFVCYDVLPNPRANTHANRGKRQRIPIGLLTGLAASIKVTAALFIVYFALTRQWRAMWTSLATVASTSLLALVILPRESIGFWRLLLEGDTRTGPPYFLMNQSVLGVVTRLVSPDRPAVLAGLGLGVLVALLGVVAAARWYRRGDLVMAAGLVGIATGLAAPLSWTHHFVWILVIGAVALRPVPAGAARVNIGLRALIAVYSVWVAAAVFKVIVAWGGDVELTYGPSDQVLSNVGPVAGVILLGWALVEGLRPAATAGRRVTGSVVAADEPPTPRVQAEDTRFHG